MYDNSKFLFFQVNDERDVTVQQCALILVAPLRYCAANQVIAKHTCPPGSSLREFAGLEMST